MLNFYRVQLRFHAVFEVSFLGLECECDGKIKEKFEN